VCENWPTIHQFACDALILRCARKAGATRLLTLDRRDFERLDLAGVELIVPGR